MCLSVGTCLCIDGYWHYGRELWMQSPWGKHPICNFIYFYALCWLCLLINIRPRETVLHIDTLLCCFVQRWFLHYLLSNLYFQMCCIITVFSATDIDECQHRSLCVNGHCRNTEGSFRCVCSQGYTLSSTGDQCEGKLVDLSYWFIFFSKSLCISAVGMNSFASGVERNIAPLSFAVLCCQTFNSPLLHSHIFIVS